MIFSTGPTKDVSRTSAKFDTKMYDDKNTGNKTEEIQTDIIICNNANLTDVTAVQNGKDSGSPTTTEDSYVGSKEVYLNTLEKDSLKELKNVPVSTEVNRNGSNEYTKNKIEENLNEHKAGAMLQSKRNNEDAVDDRGQNGTDNRSGNFFSSMVKILRSPVFIFLTLANTGLCLLLTAMSVFFPKVVQNQFNQTAARSGLLAGSLSMNNSSERTIFLNVFILVRKCFCLLAKFVSYI